MPIELVSFAHLGGAPIGTDGRISVPAELMVPSDVEKRGYHLGNCEETTGGVDAFAQSACLVTSGKKITRSDVILYVSYVRFGIHSSEKVHKKHEAAMKCVQEFEKTHFVYQMDYIYHELLCTAYLLVRSGDCTRFFRRAKSLAWKSNDERVRSVVAV